MKIGAVTKVAALFSYICVIQRPSGTPSFVARRKIEEKGEPRRRKLHILRFAFRGKSSVIPLLLLSPPNPLRWALAGPLLAISLNPLGVVFWRMPDVLCAYVFATVRVTRLSRLRRSAYPLASAYRVLSQFSARFLHFARRNCCRYSSGFLLSPFFSKNLSPHSLFSTKYPGRMCYNGIIQGSRILAP